MSTTYPAILPRPQREGYTLTVSAASTTTQRDRTIARRRQVGLGSLTVAALSFVFTESQYAVWCGWWRYELQNGSLPASMKLPNGAGDAVQTVRFLSTYTATDAGGLWQVGVQAELVNPPRLSSADLTALGL